MKTHLLLNKAPYFLGGERLLVLLQLAVITLLTAMVVLLCNIYFDLMVFDKVAINHGEYWRLVSGHFTHSSFSHSAWDVLAFSCSLIWLRIYSVRAILPSVVAGIFLVNILLLSSWSSLNYYCGLSGILFSPLIVAAYLHAKRHRGGIDFLPLAVIVLKLAIDMATQEAILVNSEWPAYPESHIAGAIAGVFTIIFLGFIKRFDI